MSNNLAEAKSDDAENGCGNSQLITKPGQKFPTPSPGNGDRVFYETLLKQRPDSEMAQEWCVAYGILNDVEASALYQKISKRKAKLSGQSPAKTKNQSSNKDNNLSSKSNKPKPKRRKVDDDDDDDDDILMDTGLGDSSIWEGQGTSGI
eukprot:gene8345-17192_t